MTIEQMLQWKEPRITLNESHSFWSMKNPIMTLQGQFVKDCLWIPKMYYISVDKISFNNPTPTEAVGSPISYHLNHTRSITSWFHISKLTLSCGMDFSWYPFDIQVFTKLTPSFLSYLFNIIEKIHTRSDFFRTHIIGIFDRSVMLLSSKWESPQATEVSLFIMM